MLHTLPDGGPVYGVTSLDNLLYVLRGGTLSHQVEVYDTASYRFQRCITIPGLGNKVDMIACTCNCCAYLSDSSNERIHRVALPDGADVTSWPVYDTPSCLSVTQRTSLLVTFDVVRKIKEYTTDGKLLRQIHLPRDFLTPRHTIHLSSGELVVCHGRIDRGDPVHRVCSIRTDGHIFESYGGPRGSGPHQMNSPTHLAVGRHGFVFVADFNNQRVLLLSPMLTFVREVLSREQLAWMPLRLWLDSDRRILYVGVNEYINDKHTAGRVVVVSM